MAGFAHSPAAHVQEAARDGHLLAVHQDMLDIALHLRERDRDQRGRDAEGRLCIDTYIYMHTHRHRHRHRHRHTAALKLLLPRHKTPLHAGSAPP